MTIAVVLPEIGTHALGTSAIPVEHYISQEFYEREKREIFAKTWLLVGRVTDIAKAGDFLTYLVETLDASVLIVRGRDMKLRAFYNACTHRGARIEGKACGNARALVCGFHGWAFNLDGSLAHVPDEALFADLDHTKLGLRQVSVDEWGGFVFINLDPAPSIPLRTFLAPLDDAFDRYLGNPDWSWSFGWRARFKANWKLLIDAQIEGYHVDMTHRKTIAGAIPGSNAPAYIFPESLGVPGGVGAYRPAEIDMSSQTEVAQLSAKFGATSLYTKPGRDFVAQDGTGVLKDDHPLWIFDNYILFPNIVMFVQKGQILLQRTTPIGPDECVWEVDFFHTERAETFGQAFNFEQGRIQIRDVLSEDLYTAEGIQANFKAGAISEILLNKQEVVVRAFYRRVLQAVQGSGPVPFAEAAE
jgi:phenylpropionate dioxygenase-like ring-hydroxylating dioxygenase large terminal subunit